nr:hypothetical protein [Candidatus Sigynarchaeota archaeon]
MSGNERGRGGGGSNQGRPGGRPRGPPRNPRGRVDGRRGRKDDGETRREFHRDGGPPRFSGPRTELRGKEFHVFIHMIDRFADDVIRNEFVQPAIEKLNMSNDVDCIVFKAKGQAINVAVRAATLLENVMGVMQKKIRISSEAGRPKASRDGKDRGNGEKDRDRMVSSIEISLKRF